MFDLNRLARWLHPHHLLLTHQAGSGSWRAERRLKQYRRAHGLLPVWKKTRGLHNYWIGPVNGKACIQWDLKGFFYEEKAWPETIGL